MITKYHWFFLLFLVSLRAFSQDAPETAAHHFPELSFNFEDARTDWAAELIRTNQSWLANEVYLKSHLSQKADVLVDGVLYSVKSKKVGEILQLKPESKVYYSTINVLKWIAPVSATICCVSFFLTFPLLLSDLSNPGSELKWSTISSTTSLITLPISLILALGLNDEYKLAIDAYMKSRYQ